MKTNELRLGNYILTSGGRLISVTIENIVKVAKNISEYKPIPLTEEWIIGLGFGKHDSTTFEKNGYYFDLEDTTFYNDWPSNASTLNKNVKYLHQIQNLYFALTGEELLTK